MAQTYTHTVYTTQTQLFVWPNIKLLVMLMSMLNCKFSAGHLCVSFVSSGLKRCWWWEPVPVETLPSGAVVIVSLPIPKQWSRKQLLCAGRQLMIVFVVDCWLFFKWVVKFVKILIFPRHKKLHFHINDFVQKCSSHKIIRNIWTNCKEKQQVLTFVKLGPWNVFVWKMTWIIIKKVGN